MIESNELAVGIDVSGESLHVARSDERRVRRFGFDPEGLDPEGLDRLVAFLESLGESLVVVCLEATGGIERPLVDRLHDRGLPVAVVNAKRVRDFARSDGVLAKTDDVDARQIARFAATMTPRLSPPTSPNHRKLRDLTARRTQLVGLLVAERNRRSRAFDPDARASVDRSIAFHDAELKRLDALREKLLAEEAELRRRVERLASVPGVGQVTAATLISEMPELGAASPKQIASLAGLAPHPRDSGKLRGVRTIGGGRSAVRTAMYMPTIVAMKHNPRIREFYERLVAAGKPKMVALTASMRKLLTILNAMLRDDRDFETRTKTA